jgi:hypothetical protein
MAIREGVQTPDQPVLESASPSSINVDVGVMM